VDLNSAAGRQMAHGAKPDSRSGGSLHAGDLTGDYYNKELVIGSPEEDSGRGSVRIRFGGRVTTADFTTNDVDVVITGGAASDHFGAATDAGHVTRHDIVVVNQQPVNPTARDLVVGAPDAQGGKGEVYLFAPPFITSERRTTADAVYRITGQHAAGHLGTEVETADLNGDGFREIIATEPGTGCVVIVDFHNARTTTRTCVTAPGIPDNRIAIATGDLTGDGIFDLAIGVPGAGATRGAVYVFAGRSGALPGASAANATASLAGVDIGDETGAALDIRDIDDDSDPTEDLVIGAPGADGAGNGRTNSGEVYVVWGARTLSGTMAPNLTLLGAASGHRLGTEVVAGNIKRDGPNDVVMLAAGANFNAGEVYSYYGRHRYEFPSSGVADLVTATDRRVISQRGVGPVESLVIWESTGRGGEEIVVGVPSATTSAGTEAGRLYFALSPQVDLSNSQMDVTVSQCGTANLHVVVTNPSAVSVRWQIDTRTPWLRVNVGGGTTVSGTPGRFWLVAVTKGLSAGTYTGDVTVMSRGRDLMMDSKVSVRMVVTAAAPSARTAGTDFTGDGCGDPAVFRPATGTWHVPGRGDVPLGQIGDIPVPGDYNGDLIGEPAVYRPSNSTWYFQGSQIAWGQSGDVPVAADYDGDGRTDIAVYRPSTATWLVRGQASVAWGGPGDIPVPADYDGDGRAEFAVYVKSTGTWRIQNGDPVQWGGRTDIPVPADFNGDGRADIAVYRRGTGMWYVREQFSTQWGGARDIPLPMDVNRDGRADLVVYRPADRTWYAFDQVTGFITTTAWGAAGDRPAGPAWQVLAAAGIAGDVNGDGYADVLWLNDASRQASVWYMSGPGGNDFAGWDYVSASGVSGWRVVGSGDFNGDDVADVVWQNDQTRQASVWYLGGANGTTFQGWNWLSMAGVAGWKIAATADFNRDGKPDLVWLNDQTRQASVWYMGGAEGNVLQGWEWLTSTGVSGWSVVAAADFNGDQSVDLVWQDDSSRQASVWYMGGTGGSVFQGWSYLAAAGVPEWRIVGVRDFDGDGKPDVVWQHDTSRRVTLWYMGGAQGTEFLRWGWIRSTDIPGWTAIVR
jgi:hypothetical protein